jgi:hypothetical protein
VRSVLLFVPVIIVLAVAAAVFGIMSPGPDVVATTGATSISSVNSSYEINSGNTDNVYQQQVVALWATKDFLNVIAEQNVTLINAQVETYQQQQTIRSLLQSVLIVLVLLVGLIGGLGVLWSVNNQKNRLREPETPTPAVAESQITLPSNDEGS